MKIKKTYSTKKKHQVHQERTRRQNSKIQTFEELCNNEGIFLQQFTAPYNHHKTSSSEGFNKTIINSAKAILKGSQT